MKIKSTFLLFSYSIASPGSLAPLAARVAPAPSLATLHRRLTLDLLHLLLCLLALGSGMLLSLDCPFGISFVLTFQNLTQSTEAAGMFTTVFCFLFFR